MAESQLLTHCGARAVTRDELENVPIPAATRTWYPLAHAHVLDRVQNRLEESGFEVASAQYALARNDARFFGVLDLKSVLAAGVTLAVGIRNSIDKSFPISFCAGSRVFVCDNLAFNSEITVARKHTRFGDKRFVEALTRAVQSLTQFQKTEAARIKRFQLTEVTDVEAESLMLRAYEKEIVSHRLLPNLIKEWRNPSYEEFHDRNYWSLLNAFTTCLTERQKTNPQQFASLTMSVNGLLSQAIGFRPEEASEEAIPQTAA